MSFLKFKISKKRYLQTFGFCVIILALFRCINPSVVRNTKTSDRVSVANMQQSAANDSSSATKENINNDGIRAIEEKQTAFSTRFVDAQGNLVKHRIYSVPTYKEAFPDSNSLQMTAAKKWGVEPVADRDEAEHRKMELVYVGSSPYYYVEELKRSIPYLVPRAAILLHDIGKNYFDSLQIKGIPLHKPIVTSVTRSKKDVEKLRNFNRNATANSCHLYGTTFDICYNRYQTVSPPDGTERRKVRNDTLKYVLSEVLRDLREEGRCYIKYEVKQGCFHITVR